MSTYLLFGGLSEEEVPLNDYWTLNYKTAIWNEIEYASIDATAWPVGAYGYSM